MTSVDINLFKNVPLLAGLPADAVSELAAGSERRRYAKGDVILYKGDPGQVIFLILKGGVKAILEDHNGKEIILSKLHIGDYFGEMALFDRMPRSAEVVALEDSEFLVIDEKALFPLIRKNPDLAMRLLSEMSLRLREANEQIGNLALLDVRGRVARVLVKLSKGEGVQKGDQCKIVPKVAMSELSAMSGASRETVSRVLSDFSRKGLIKITKGSIVICDEALGPEL